MKNKKNWKRQRKKLEELNEKKKTTAIIEQIFPLISLQRNTSFMIACIFYYHPLINPRVNPADILSVSGIPKLVIANEEEAVTVAAWLLSILVMLVPGICVIAFESVVIAPSYTV